MNFTTLTRNMASGVLTLAGAVTLAVVALPAAAQANGPTLVEVYRNNFDSSTGSSLPEWRRFNETGVLGALNVNTAARGGSSTNRALGPYHEGSLALFLNSLPPHDTIQVEFDLYLVGNWDGSDSANDGEDHVRLKEIISSGGNERDVMYTTFSNCPGKRQHYPKKYTAGEAGPVSGGFWQALERNSLGGTLWNPAVPTGCFRNAVYRLSYSFPHTGTSLDLRWASFETNIGEGTTDERFAIDNVRVVAVGCKPYFNSCVTPRSDGRITVEYRYDGGVMQGELAIFRLDGLAPDWSTQAGREAFIAEARRRALTNSVAGYVLIRDATEKARFDGPMGTTAGDPTNYNAPAGTFLGERTFTLAAGSAYAFMLVPNGTVNSTAAPLFSFNNGNINGASQSQQSGSLSGIEDSDHRIFVFEDVVLNSDRDYEDVVFRIEGLSGSNIPDVEPLFGSGQNWLNTTKGRQVLYDE